MAWDKAHKHRSREKIVRSAALLFTQFGFDAISIDDVMREAGLTRGAFYTHFGSKSQLYAEAIVSAALAAQQRITRPLPMLPTLIQIAERYLSENHRNTAELGCPLAFLTTDIHQRDDHVRAAYTRVFRGFVDGVSQTGVDGAKARQVAVLMIGGLAIARALDDSELSTQLLEDCLAGIHNLSTPDAEED